MTQSQPAGQPLDLDPIDRRARIASTIGELVTVSRQDVPALLAEVRRLRAVEAAAYKFADEMATYCSPHGVAADYAQRLSDRLDAARTPATKEAR